MKLMSPVGGDAVISLRFERLFLNRGSIYRVGILTSRNPADSEEEETSLFPHRFSSSACSYASPTIQILVGDNWGVAAVQPLTKLHFKGGLRS